MEEIFRFDAIYEDGEVRCKTCKQSLKVGEKCKCGILSECHNNFGALGGVKEIFDRHLNRK